MLDLELFFELREGVLVAQLCAHVDKHETQRRRDRHRDQNTQQTEERAACQQGEDHNRRMEFHDPPDHERDHEVVL